MSLESLDKRTNRKVELTGESARGALLFKYLNSPHILPLVLHLRPTIV